MSDPTTQYPPFEYRKMNLYEYFLVRYSYNSFFIKMLLSSPKIRKVMTQYMKGNLPLAAATVYLSHIIAVDWRDYPEEAKILTFGPALHQKQIGTSQRPRTSNYWTSVYIKQTARFIDQIVEQNIPTDEHEQTMNNDTVLYPRPYAGTTTNALNAWLSDEAIIDHTPNNDKSWIPAVDYPEYLNYWIKAFFTSYCNMFYDQSIQSVINDSALASIDDIDIVINAETSWDRPTPFLNRETRRRLITHITADWRLKLGVGQT